MARDETARERDSEQSLLDRRSHLQLAGAAAATVAEPTVADGSSESDRFRDAGDRSELSREGRDGSE